MDTITFHTDASWKIAPIRTGHLARIFMVLGLACGVPAGIAYAYKFGGALELSPLYYVIEFVAIFAAVGCMAGQAFGETLSRFVCCVYGVAFGELVAQIALSIMYIVLDGYEFRVSIYRGTFLLRNLGPWFGLILGIVASFCIKGMTWRSARAAFWVGMSAMMVTGSILCLCKDPANWRVDPAANTLNYWISAVLGMGIASACVASVCAGIRTIERGFEVKSAEGGGSDAVAAILLRRRFRQRVRAALVLAGIVLMVKVALEWDPTRHESDRSAVARTTPATVPSSDNTLRGFSASDFADAFNAKLDAIGDKQRRAAIRSRITVGWANITGIATPVQFKLYQVFPDKMLFIASLPTGVVERGTDGKQCWEAKAGTPLRVLSPLDSYQMLIAAPIFPDAEMARFFTRVEKIGSKQIGGELCDQVRLLDVDGGLLLQSYSKASGLLVLTESIREGVTATAAYSDYRKVDGVMVPFHVTQSVLRYSTDISVVQVTHNVDVTNGVNSVLGPLVFPKQKSVPASQP